MNIEQVSYYANAAAFGLVFALWFVFAGVFFLRKRLEAPPDAKRSPLSWIGLALQGAGFGVVWAIRRSPFSSPLIAGQFTLNIVLSVIAVVIAATSMWFAMA